MRSAARVPQTRSSTERLRAENVALVNRIVLLRTALQGVTSDSAQMHRELARLRSENRALRATLTERGGELERPQAS